MSSVALLVVAAVAVATVIAISRRSPRLARPHARTVELVIDGDGVTRRLADGRREQARWADLTEIELVGTPVTTADGATSFVILTEDAEHGSLVPLGVGWDGPLLEQLSRLPGFDLRHFDERRGMAKRGRVVVWRRPGSQPANDGSNA